MKTIEKVKLTDQEHADYMNACKKLNRSMRGQTTMLIREFLKRVGKKNNKITPTELDTNDRTALRITD
jgi:hypothetical protein